MKLKQLKKNIEKFGSDDNESYVILLTVDENGDRKYSLLSAICIATNMKAILLADDDAAKILIQENTPTLQ